jgi:nitroreductase
MVRIERENAVLEVLRRRRSMSRVTSEEPPRELIEDVVAAGSWAPNHHHTRPWRFIVLAGRAREELGDVMAASLEARLVASSAPDIERQVLKERNKPLRAPVIIVVGVEPSNAPKVIEIEEIESGAAAAENILLAAEALGLGAMWRTGAAAYDPAVKRFLGLPESAHIVAFLYVGYPDLPELPDRGVDGSTFTRWIGGEEGSG